MKHFFKNTSITSIIKIHHNNGDNNMSQFNIAKPLLPKTINNIRTDLYMVITRNNNMVLISEEPFLDQNTFLELQPIKQYEINAKIDKREIIFTDTSDIPEF